MMSGGYWVGTKCLLSEAMEGGETGGGEERKVTLMRYRINTMSHDECPA